MNPFHAPWNPSARQAAPEANATDPGLSRRRLLAGTSAAGLGALLPWAPARAAPPPPRPSAAAPWCWPSSPNHRC